MTNSTQAPAVSSNLSEEAFLLLLNECGSVEALKDLHDLDDNCFLGQKEATQVMLDLVMKEYRHNARALMRIVLSHPSDEEFCFALSNLQNAVFEELLRQCTTLTALLLLYGNLPTDEAPGVDEDWHQKVLIRMIEVCGKDLSKLFMLLRDFGTIEPFKERIQRRINEVTAKK